MISPLTEWDCLFIDATATGIPGVHMVPVGYQADAHLPVEAKGLDDGLDRLADAPGGAALQRVRACIRFAELRSDEP